jgi:protein-tyrosine-phosphatase
MKRADDSDGAPLVLFVCMGNICRSPMAEAIASDFAAREKIDVRVTSAGMSALEGHEATELTRSALADIGLSIDGHRARQLTRELVDSAALVITATARQRNDLHHFFKDDRSKIASFDDLTHLGDLTDPYGSGADAFSRTASLLQRGMPAIFSALQERD